MFNVVIANPPYMKGLHLSFLDKAIRYSEQSIFIHPSEWVVSKRRSLSPKRKRYTSLRNELMSIGASVSLIKNPWKEVDIFMPLSITYIDRKTKQDLNVVSQWINGDLEKSFLDKVYTKTPEMCDKYKNRRGQWYSSLSDISANGYTDLLYLDGVQRKIKNEYSLTNCLCLEPTQTPSKTKKGKIKSHIGFNTKDEAQNFIDFITKTVFIRAYLAIIKIDQQGTGMLKDIPFLDFTKQWDDTSLYKFYDLSAEEIKMLNDIVEKISV